MKKLLVLLTAFTILLLSACQSPNVGTTDFSSSDPPISKKQYMTHDETEIFEWKCDIPPTQIKVYKGSPLEGFFITVDDQLYAYNAQEIFPETDKNYRKVDTDLKISHIHYHWQMNKLTVLSEDFKTYSYDNEQDTFVRFENDFGSVVQEFSDRGRILSWSSSNSNLTNFWFMDEKGDVYSINQTYGTISEYTQTLLCTMPTDENILSADTGVIKTETKFYCFDSQKSCFVVAEQPTAAYDNIAFLNDIIVLYKDDPAHIYDHLLVNQVKFSYY